MAAGLLVQHPASAEVSPGPALSESPATYAAALQCSAALATAAQDPVLLIHGTGSTGPESWGPGFYPALRKQGRVVCMVTLPDRAIADIQRTSEWAVWAIRHMSATSGRQVAVIGHSQGTLQPLWAMRWWPDISAMVSDYIGMAGPFHGTTQASRLCAMPIGCNPVAWQYRTRSAFLATLFKDGVRPLAPGPDYTTIASRFDELATPAPAATRMEGAANLVIQDICPGRPVEHVAMLVDAVSFAIALDALTHGGPASQDRIDHQVCAQPFLPGADPIQATRAVMSIIGFLSVFVTPIPAEPELMPYARAAATP